MKTTHEIPKVGELWRCTASPGLETTFWLDVGFEPKPGTYQGVRIRGGEIVLVLEVEKNYIDNVKGLDRVTGKDYGWSPFMAERDLEWRVRVLVGEQVCHRGYGNIVMWHRNFERVK